MAILDSLDTFECYAIVCSYMASLHRQTGKPNWFCAFSTSDGKRHFKSTGTSDKKQAQEICRTWAKASLYGEKLNADKAREIIAGGVADVLAAMGESLPSSTIREWCKRWLEIKEIENERSTHKRYEQAIRVWLEFLGGTADKNLEGITTNIILKFRDACSTKSSVGSTNTNLRVIRACLNSARQQGLIGSNPASLVKTLKERGENKRREMTLEEIQRVLKVCDKTPWRGLVLVGLYTGQRLGDCARLTWQQVDLMKKTISFITQKTGKSLSLGLAEPLVEYLNELPSVDDARAHVFPRFADLCKNETAPLSRAFAEEILIPTGLILPRAKRHASTGKGRKAKRNVNEVTFHSLRHSFVTMLKVTGASNALAQMIVGHNSAAVNAHYTHLSAKDSVESIRRLPDVTRPA